MNSSEQPITCSCPAITYYVRAEPLIVDKLGYMEHAATANK